MLAGLVACEKVDPNDPVKDNVTTRPVPDNGGNGGNSGNGGDSGSNTGGNDNGGKDDNDGNYSAKEGVEYMFDGSCIPEMHVTVPLNEWNNLLKAYDANNNTTESVLCSVLYDKAGEKTEIDQVSIRLRGNTSRRRPEGNGGEEHKSSGANWHHCHFQLNFRKNVKDDAHELHGARKVVLKWFKDDPCYVREIYCYDLFRRFGVWTAPHAAYCRLWLKIEGDASETYFGVYEMIEPLDARYAKVRKEEFGDKDGFLWKCRYGASLATTNSDFGADLGDGREHVYELKTETDDYAAAEAQLKDFILKLNGKGEESFHKWIQEVCDVDMLLRTYAVNVAVGMWDDYWNNMNNYYLYFNSKDKYQYKFWLVPFDYDNTLGTSTTCGVQSDSGRQDPFNWGNNSNLLIYRILKFDDFRETYKQALLELVGEDNGYLYYKASLERIVKWQSQIASYVSNDTGEDMKISDQPASWGNHSEYRLKEENNNFFKVKTETINNYCR